MKIFTSEQTREIDKYTIENEPIASIDLMERASIYCSNWLLNKFKHEQIFKIFVGCGNNGGDGLAIARMLATKDFHVNVYCLQISKNLSPDFIVNLEKLKKQGIVSIKEIFERNQLPQINKNDVVIDAILGSGLSRPIDGLTLETISYLNACIAHKIAIDIPSGLPGEGIVEDNKAFKAQYTLTFQNPFLSFFFPENAEFIGIWTKINIGLHKEIIKTLQSDYFITEINDIEINKRPEFGHKGTYGHALIVAGSKGMAGAAILSSKACLKSGCGLVTIYTASINNSIIQTSFPEAIVLNDCSEECITEIPELNKYSAIAIGPGIGTNLKTQNIITEMLSKCSVPIVLDADALNIISINPDLLSKLPKKSILTPHPGEFDRLFGKSKNSFERFQKQQQLAIKYNIIIVLKGRYTCIAMPDGKCYLNTTGNNGMATAGSGDVLTGIIVSLLAQKYEPGMAAKVGVFLHGLAGDIACNNIEPESIIASDIIYHISNAFRTIKLSKNENA